MGGVAVVLSNGQRHLMARTRFAAGDRILTIDGVLVARPSRYSLQVDDDLHIDVPAGVPEEQYPWRFLNHSCAPSAAVRGREIVALLTIAPGDEITFDYNTTEYEMDAPFVCRCKQCGGREIRGFRTLDRQEQERLRPLLAEHLLRRLA